MGRDLTLPSTRLISAAHLAADILFEGENSKEMFAIDVGCDHAKLAIYLIQSGICKSVLASDINEGPVKKARANVLRRRFWNSTLDKYIRVQQNDGLKGYENERADRVFILGMGGELIASILEQAGFVKDSERKTGYILQPMTSEYELRRYLYGNGFDIKKEELVLDKGRIYSVMLCVYDGVVRVKSECELYIGEYNIKNKGELFAPYLERKINIQKKLISSLEKAGKNADEHIELVKEFEKQI